MAKTPDGFERRDSVRRYVDVKVTPPNGGDVDAKGVVSLRGIFFEGAAALPETWSGALVGVSADLGGFEPLQAVCLVTRTDSAKNAGFMLTWKTLEFEAERELARYLDEKDV